MNFFTKCIKHFNLVNKHRWYVFVFSVRAGIPIRGLLHDLSKYSPTEFFESVKFFNGHRSPIYYAKKNIGYSKAWLHHKGRNKHHLEYWEDISENVRFGAFIPYKYLVECICDRLSAGKTYNGKRWANDQPLNYWNNIDKKSTLKIHPGVVEFMDTVLNDVSKVGINKTLKPAYLRKLYNEIYSKYFIQNI